MCGPDERRGGGLGGGLLEGAVVERVILAEVLTDGGERIHEDGRCADDGFNVVGTGSAIDDRFASCQVS